MRTEKEIKAAIALIESIRETLMLRGITEQEVDAVLFAYRWVLNEQDDEVH